MVDVDDSDPGKSNLPLNAKQREVYLYEPTDKGPFCVFIENGGGFINIVTIGELIYSLNYKPINRILRVNKQKIKVICGDYRAANHLIKDKKLAEKGFEVFIPKDFLLSVGIINNIPTTTKIDAIKKKYKLYWP